MTDGPDWLTGFVAVTETRTAVIEPAPIASLAAMLDLDPVAVSRGRPLPPLWHWVALAEWAKASTIGVDGHPITGGFMPATPYPRRMWIGTAVEIAAAPIVGDEVRVERVVSDLVEKTGRNGTFAIATVTTTVTSRADAALLTERTQFAYRPAAVSTEPARSQPAPSGPWLARPSSAGWDFRPDPVMLAMFSAATANGHRIHYDVPYAREVEGYPNLLVHGPLMAVVAAEVARREMPDRDVAAFTCQARRPMFLGDCAGVIVASDRRANAVTVDVTAEDSPYLTATVSFR